MAIPTVRFYRRICMAFITKFLFTGVTLHTGVHQALLIHLVADLHIKGSVSGAKNLIPPLVQQLHMIRTHFRYRQNAFLHVFRQLRLWYRPGITVVVPDRKCDKQDEDNQSRNYFTTVVHFFSSTPARGLKYHGSKTFVEVLRSLFTIYNQGVTNQFTQSANLNIRVPVIH